MYTLVPDKDAITIMQNDQELLIVLQFIRFYRHRFIDEECLKHASVVKCVLILFCPTGGVTDKVPHFWVPPLSYSCIPIAWVT